MLICAKNFRRHIMKSELYYKLISADDERVVFSVPHKGRYYLCTFDGEEGKNLAVKVVIGKVPEERVPLAIICANGINAKYKWVRLFVDENNDFIAVSDTILAPSAAAVYASELLVDRLIGILETNEKLIEKAVNG